MQTTIELIERAQSGHAAEKEALFGLIMKEHMGSFTRRYRGRNVLLDDADIESEFMFGCLRALEQVRLDTGNPLFFLLWKGDRAVATLLRGRIKKGVRAECRTCGANRSVLVKGGRPICAKCGSWDLKTGMVEGGDLPDREAGGDRTKRAVLSPDRVSIEAQGVWSVATHGVMVEEIQSRLRGRVRELFDLIIVEEINRETSKNYVKEIAGRWGVTTACVSVYLRKLRAEIERYLLDG